VARGARVYAAAPDPPRRRGLFIGLMGGVAVAFAIGLVVGYAIWSGGEKSSSSVSAGAGPTHRVAGVPVGWAHTADGALGAAAAFSEAYGRLIAPSGRQTEVLAAFTTPGFRRRAGALIAQTAAALAGRLGAGATVRVSTLGVHLVSYQPDRAQVAVWTVAVASNGSDFGPFASWGQGTADLVWSGGDWRLDGVSTSPSAPTPALIPGAKPTPAPAFVQQAAQFGATPSSPGAP